ncbi:hypothetical protein PNEG_03389 [Pneumocystis murina B123]|uniref:Ataxin-10 homolog n=1 Tax=Pneumocystis murina (strain B123) TaxID=1069680 RepID=M7P2Z6_PNEMU|nr:hypothetical protein PNEG_03389 [Pneumocystis murina B123]EMR08220.1 hypothetical protein PNEG_03389 [Pneumocystis murina B123]
MYKYRRFASKSSHKLCNRLYPKYSLPVDKQNELDILEAISEDIVKLHKRLDICGRLNHISICFDPVYYGDNVFLYGLDLAGNTNTCIFYKACEICRILEKAIRLHIDVYKRVNEEINVISGLEKLSCLETCVFRSLCVFDDLISLNYVEKGMFLIALFKVLDSEILEWFCFGGHKKEMNALLVFLNDLFRDNSSVCDILFNNDMGKEMMILFFSFSEKMYMDEISNNFELLQSLFFSFIQNDKVHELFVLMNKSGFQISDSQLVFLKFLNTFLSNYTNQKIIISEKMCEFIESMLNLFCLSMVEIVKTQVFDSNQIFIKSQKILKATEILISCAFHVSKNSKEKQLLLKNDLLKSLINLLQSIDDYSMTQNKTSKILSNNSNKVSFPYFKRDIIQLLSTLCFRNKKVQDDIRELHGLGLILSQCRIDDENPYLREYAIFCLRNVLEDNEKNKELLRNMKPIGLQNSEITDKLGLTLEIMNKTRISI